MREIDDVARDVYSKTANFRDECLDLSKEKVRIVTFKDPDTHEIIETEIYPAEIAQKANHHRLAMCLNPYMSFLSDYLNTPFYWINRGSAATNGLAIAFNPVFATTLYLGGQMELDELDKASFTSWQLKPDIEKGLRYGGLTASSYYEARHFMFVVMHEVYHQVYLHLKRESIKLGAEMFQDRYKHHVANLAQDMEINRDIEATWPNLFGGCTKAIGGVWYEDFPKDDGKLFLTEPWEPIFDHLMNHPEQVAKFPFQDAGFDLNNGGAGAGNTGGRDLKKKYTPGEYAVKTGEDAQKDMTEKNAQIAIGAADAASNSTKQPLRTIDRELDHAYRTYNQTRDIKAKLELDQLRKIADIINDCAKKAAEAAKKAAEHADDPFEAGKYAIECGNNTILIEKIMQLLQPELGRPSGSGKQPQQQLKKAGDDAIEKGQLAEQQKTALSAQEAADAAQNAAEQAQQEAQQAQEAADQAQQQAQQSGSQSDKQAAQQAQLAADQAQRAADQSQQAADQALLAADQAQQAADNGDKQGELQAAQQAGQQAQQAGQQANQAQQAGQQAQQAGQQGQLSQLQGQQGQQDQQGNCQNGNCQNGSCQRPGGNGSQSQSGQSGQSGQGGQQGGQLSDHNAGDNAIEKGREAQLQQTALSAQQAADAAQNAANDAQSRANAAQYGANKAAADAAETGSSSDKQAAQNAQKAADEAQKNANAAQDAANAAQDAADAAQEAANNGDSAGESKAASEAGKQALKAGQSTNDAADDANASLKEADKASGASDNKGKGGNPGKQGGNPGGNQGGDPNNITSDPGQFFGGDDVMSTEDLLKLIEDCGQNLHQQDGKNPENEAVRRFHANKENLRRSGPPNKSRSKFGKSIAEVVDEVESIVFTKSQVNWKGKLAKIFNFATKEEEKMTMSKRRMGSAEDHPWYDSRYIKPKVATHLLDDGLLLIFFLVDSSGSMWGNLTAPDGEQVSMFDYIFGEIISLEKQCKVKHSGLAYFCTGTIDDKKSIHKWDYNDTLHKGKLLNKIKFHSGDQMQGGTDISPILASLLQLHTKHIRKEPPTTLLIVSDGYDDYKNIGEIMKKTGFSRLLKRLFFLLITDEKNYEAKKAEISAYCSEQRVIWVDSAGLK